MISEDSNKIENNIPTVFISYSHDSKVHKQWVLELAQKLRQNGVDIIIDQWDLDPGDDAVKFMEYWVQNSDRVLMICTEPYVNKVNEGEGGAGYEATIVTQELVRNSGTKKFIPIIRQSQGSNVLPTCVGTRMAVNLTDSPEFEDEFRKLVHEIHLIPPATKPPLGNPPTQPVIQNTPLIKNADQFPNDLNELHEFALNLARRDDKVNWRLLIQAKKAAVYLPLQGWRQKWENQISKTKKPLPEIILDGLDAYQPLFTVALAGMESCQRNFNQQGALIYDLREPSKWERSGYIALGSFPETSAFVFQAIHGAMCVLTQQVSLSLSMATQRVSEPNSSESGPLYLNHGLIGWPQSLGENWKFSMNFLWELPERWDWLADKFDGIDKFRECLCGYYTTLSLLELISIIKAGNEQLLNDQNFRLDVPPMFIAYKEHAGGIRKLLDDREAIIYYSEKVGVSKDSLIKYWPVWKQRNCRVNEEVTRRINFLPSDMMNAYEHFIEDLYR